ncbi:MAG: PrsW family intramembrane metalloprotease [Treponema sp.]|nr:PrsW family intramembrane metalloprotease [Treponema sp.]
MFHPDETPSLVYEEEKRGNMFCIYCGQQLEDDAVFCPKCGKKIETHSETEDVKAPVPETQESKAAPTNHEEKFHVRNLFVNVFKKHTAREKNEILKAGMDEAPAVVEITTGSFKPWFYSRVFMVIFAAFLIMEICLLNYNNSNIMPGVMLIGSLIMPFTLLTMYFELNVYRDISFFKVAGIFLLGGAASLLFTLFLYSIIPPDSDSNFQHAALVSVIEELGKAVIVIVLLKRTKNMTTLQGLLIGGAVGVGFAVFESAGYAFNVFLHAYDYNVRADIGNKMFPNYLHYEYADSLGEMNFNIFLRSVLAFGGHTAWAAIEGASFGREKKINLRFIKYFAICFILHALWDTDTQAYYLKLTVLCIAAWWVIIRQLETFIRENADPAMQMKAQEAAEKQREARKLAVKMARDKCIYFTLKILEIIIKIILFAGIGILILLIIP